MDLGAPAVPCPNITVLGPGYRFQGDISTIAGRWFLCHSYAKTESDGDMEWGQGISLRVWWVAPGARIREQLLSYSAIKSHDDAIQQLDLPREVIDTVSLWQIRENIRSISATPTFLPTLLSTLPPKVLHIITVVVTVNASTSIQWNLVRAAKRADTAWRI